MSAKYTSSTTMTTTSTSSSAGIVGVPGANRSADIDNLMEEEKQRQTHFQKSQLMDIRVGWSYPIDSETLHFNFHLSIDHYDWKEVIDYYSLEELHQKLQVIPQYSNELEIPTFLLIDRDGITRFQRLLLQTPHYTPQVIKVLDNHLKVLETWIVCILTNLSKFNEDTRRICKTLFFRSVEKINKFELLLLMTSTRDMEINGNSTTSGDNATTGKDGTTGGAVRRGSMMPSLSPQKLQANRVLKSMNKLFGGGNGSGSNASVVSSSSGALSGQHDTVVDEDNRSVMSGFFGGGGSRSLNRKNLEEMDKNSSRNGGSSVQDGGIGDSNSDGGDGRASLMQKAGRRKSLMGRLSSASGIFKKNKDDRLEAIDEDSDGDDGGNGDESGRKSKSVGGTGKAKSALEVAAKSVMLRIEVQRGEETLHGVVVYDITIRVVGKKYKNPMVFTASQRFSNFKKLHQKLIDINNELTILIKEGKPSPYADFVHLIKAPFPSLPMKCYLGLSLNDSELSQRTRLLDAWFREVCIYYRNMPNNARQEIRDFLKFDLTQQKDIFFQDQLAWGTIENEKNNKPILIVNQSVLDNAPDELMEEIETMSRAGGATGNGGRGTIGGGNASAAANANANLQDKLERATVRSGQSENAQLQNLLWETASMGGASKLPKKKASASRSIIKNMY